MFRNIPDAEAEATVDAAWQQAPASSTLHLSTALACRKHDWGYALAKYKRDEYRLSTKVGRMILDDETHAQARNFGEKGDLFKFDPLIRSSMTTQKKAR